MASKRRWMFGAALLLLVASAADAAPSAADKENARRLMDEGKARLKAGEASRAVESYSKAHEIMHVPTTGLALAKAYVASGHLVEAREVASEVAKMPREGGEPSVFDSARKHAKELDGQLKARIPTLRIKIKGGPATKVAIDDVEVANAEAPVPVNPGKRIVSAKNSEGDAKGEVEVSERETKEVELILPDSKKDKETAAASKPSSDGKKPDSSSSSSVESSKPPDDGNYIAPQERSLTATVLMYGGFGLAAVGTGAGAATGLMALGAASDVKPQCENNICAPSARDSLGTAQTFSTVSTIAFIVAGVGIAAGIVGFMMPKETTFRMKGSAFRVGPSGLEGTF